MAGGAGDGMGSLRADELVSGAVVQVRGLRWIVSDVAASNANHPTGTPTGMSVASTLVDLQSIEDDRFNETLSVIWVRLFWSDVRRRVE